MLRPYAGIEVRLGKLGRFLLRVQNFSAEALPTKAGCGRPPNLTWYL